MHPSVEPCRTGSVPWVQPDPHHHGAVLLPQLLSSVPPQIRGHVPECEVLVVSAAAPDGPSSTPPPQPPHHHHHHHHNGSPRNLTFDQHIPLIHHPDAPLPLTFSLGGGATPADCVLAAVDHSAGLAAQLGLSPVLLVTGVHRGPALGAGACTCMPTRLPYSARTRRVSVPYCAALARAHKRATCGMLLASTQFELPRVVYWTATGKLQARASWPSAQLPPSWLCLILPAPRPLALPLPASPVPKTPATPRTPHWPWPATPPCWVSPASLPA